MPTEGRLSFCPSYHWEQGMLILWGVWERFWRSFIHWFFREDFHDTDSSHSMWMAVDGKNEFCTCCESTCGMRKIRALSDNATGNACQQERAQCFISHAWLQNDCVYVLFFFFFFKVERWEAEVTVGPIVVEWKMFFCFFYTFVTKESK